MISDAGGARKQRGRGLAAEAVAAMGALVIVETQGDVLAPLQGCAARDVAPAERPAPVLLQSV